MRPKRQMDGILPCEVIQSLASSAIKVVQPAISISMMGACENDDEFVGS